MNGRGVVRSGGRLRACLFAIGLLALNGAHADQVEELRNLRDATIGLVNDLVEQGLLSREKADAIIRKALAASAPAQTTQTQAPPAGGAAPASGSGAPATGTPTAQQGETGGASAPTPPGVIRVPYIPEAVKQEIREQIKQDVVAQAKSERWGEPGAFPAWLGHVTLAGDIRVRLEGDRFPMEGSPNASAQLLQLYGWNIDNTTTPHDRARIRARLGLTADVGETVTAGFRLASGGVGTGANPVSTYQTLGNFNSNSSVGFDRAYLTYHPWSWLSFTAGRLGQPFFVPTSLIWADDLSLEGFVLNLTPRITGQNGLFLTAGAFPILDVEPSPVTQARSKWLYGTQLGVDWRLPEASRVRFAVALYDYRNIEGIPDPTLDSTQFDATAAPFRQKGNTYFDIEAITNTTNGTQNYVWGVASKFHEANASLGLDLGFFNPYHILIDADYVRNQGFDRQEILERTGLSVVPHVVGYQARLTVGSATLVRRNAWQLFFGYRYVQRDATLDAFTDDDFRLGGTDAQGYFVGGRYALDANSVISLRWLSGRQIDYRLSPTLYDSIPLAIDVAQIDLTTSF